MTGRLSTVLVGMAVMVSAAPARAQVPAGPHFIFTVPVRLANLPPEVQTYGVSCAVRAVRFGPVLGAGVIRGGVVGTALGSVNADVVVTVTANPLADPALATEYSCEVGLMGSPPPGSASGGLFTWLDFGNTRFPLAPTAPFAQAVRGLIPR